MHKQGEIKENMGLTTWKSAPYGKIVKSDVSVAKNYLSVLEIEDLNQFRQAKKKIPKKMEDWAKKLDVFKETILQGKGKVT